MKKLLLLALILRGPFCDAQNVKFVANPTERKVDVFVEGQFFTAYIYPSDSILKKPVLCRRIFKDRSCFLKGKS